MHATLSRLARVHCLPGYSELVFNSCLHTLRSAELSDNENMCADYNGNLEASPWAGGLRPCGIAEGDILGIPTVLQPEDALPTFPSDGMAADDHGAADPDENIVVQHIVAPETVSSSLASLPPPNKEEDEAVTVRQQEEGSNPQSLVHDADKLAAVPLAPQDGDEDQGREAPADETRPQMEPPAEIPSSGSADTPTDTSTEGGHYADEQRMSISRLNGDEEEDRAYSNILEEMGGEYLGSTAMGYVLVGFMVILLSAMAVVCTLMILRVSGGRDDRDVEHDNATPAAPDRSPGMTWHKFSGRQGDHSKGSGADLDVINKILMGQASARDGSGSLGYPSSNASSGQGDRGLIHHAPNQQFSGTYSSPLFHHHQSPQVSMAGCGAAAATAPSSEYKTWDGSATDYACSPAAISVPARRPSSVSVELQPNHDMSGPVSPWASAGFTRPPMTYHINGSHMHATDQQVAHNCHPQAYRPTMQLARTKSMEPLIRSSSQPVGSMHRAARPTAPGGSSSRRRREAADDVNDRGDGSQKSSGSSRQGSGVLFLDD